VARVEKMGDLFEAVLELKQRLPDLKTGAVAPESIEIAAQADEEYPAAKKAGRKKKPSKGATRKSRKT
jgi:hypothetical protein